MPRGPFVVVLAALTLSGSALGPVIAQAPSTSTRLVEIDAVVTDALSRSVTDLTAADFSVVEDGTPDVLERVRYVPADGAVASEAAVVPVASRNDEQTEASKNGARLFAFFLDEYHVDAGPASERVRDVMTRIIQQDLGPRDLAVVVKPLDSLLGLKLTHDRDELLRAVATFEGRKGDYAPRGAFEQNYIAAAPVRAEQQRSQIVVSALNALSAHLAGLGPGRKTAVLLSEGFAPPPRRRDEPLPTIDAVVRTANRGAVSIYALDPRALGASLLDGQDTGGDTLKTLAAQTDGRSMLTTAEADAGLPHIAGDLRGYYLLTFRPAHPADVRTFHPVQVAVKRPTLAIHNRTGYWSVSAEELLRARTERRAETPRPPPQPMRHASPLIRPWFGLARDASGQSGVMQVSFVWEPVPPVPGERVRQPPTVVVLKALRGSDGATVFMGDVRPSTAAGDTSADVPAHVMFETAPGRLLVEIEIQDADAHVLDTDIRDLDVGALAGAVEVGTAEVLRTRNAREYREVDADPEAVPVAARDFHRAERLLVRIPVYGATQPLTISATLSSKFGTVMRDLAVVPVAGTALYQTDLSLASLAVGEYVIDIKAKGPDGDAHDAVRFRVVP